MAMHLDKTWKEIDDAVQAGKLVMGPSVVLSSGVRIPAFGIYTQFDPASSENNIFGRDAYLVFCDDGDPFVAFDPDDYPTTDPVASGGGSGGEAQI